MELITRHELNVHLDFNNVVNTEDAKVVSHIETDFSPEDKT
ncbi:MAG: hypothetical protein OQK46_02815 [Gammaproteobacteria bacterium]|nr:hypothetical protein [Gammaproteobacteria bacterium]